MARNRSLAPNTAEAFEGLKADYSAAKANRFRRRRTGVPLGGAGADYHYRSESDYLRVMEYARDFDRNDMIVGSTVDKAVSNTIQEGFTLLAETGDSGLDQELVARWNAWSNDADQCDVSGEMTWWEFEQLALRHCFVDGDICFLPNADTGGLEPVEAHRLRTPSGTTKNVVHGVEMDAGTRRRLSYWFTREDVAPSAAVKNVNEIKKYAARDADGFKQVWHVLTSRKRCSQTRGISAFAPVFDACGMFEDVAFATLVRQQLAACFAVLRERQLTFDATLDPPKGPRTTETVASGVTRILEGVGPGMEIASLPGETLKMDSPRIPGPEFLPHMKFVLTIIGINLGLPLVLVLMDASETNFSGYRGAVDQARMGFRDNQKRLRKRLHTPTYLWKVRTWAERDPTLRRRLTDPKVNLFGHRWRAPTWPYIQPLQDASADLLRTRNALTSHRRRCAERGTDWHDLSTEIVADNSELIEKAHVRAEALNKQYPGLGVTWREVASLPTPDGVQVNIAAQGDTDGDRPPAQPQPSK